MENIAGFKKKNYINFINIKHANNYFTNNFNIIKRERLTSLINKVQRKFV